ncbi:hypothetical protein QTP86_008437 [Hemibagrus guttatus]|nr:hypothetical protein QTP86_008437 [Hemibagrus guttatus]
MVWTLQSDGELSNSSPIRKGRELADMMERRKVDILCVQETRWKGSKARSIGAGFKLFYYGVEYGVGVVLKEEFVRNVLEVKRVSDRVMSLKLEIEGVMLNVVSGYAPQVGCELEEKERFWSELDEVMESIPTGERVVIGADVNGHVGEGNTGDEEVMGKFGVKERNFEGQMVVDFAKRMDIAVVNTYFQKREEHRVTYKSGVMNQLSEEVRQESPWTMMFADDIVICSESREQVEENLERWRFVLERRGMKVSRSKTEYMCVNEREGSGTVRLQGEEVKKVQEFKYLGSTVQSNGECGKEVKKRVQAGWNGWRKVSGVLCDRKISARIKGKVYRTVVRPAMLYGLETVSLRKRQESKLEVAELKMLRFSLGVTRLDRIRNEYIRGTAHVGHLGDKVREARLRWFGHVQRRENIAHYIITNFIPDRSRPGLTTTAIGAVDLQGAGGNWATVGRRSRGGRRVRRQREKRKGKSVGLRIGTLNVGTMTGKGRELADMMERRKVDILCVQETRWKGSKARIIGAGFKLFYYGVDSKRNGVGVVLKEEFVRNVLEVKRVSDRVMSLKLEFEGVMLNVVSGYAPQVGCELEEKERFWSELDEVMESIPTGERVVIGADFNGHVGEGNTGDEEVMGKFGVKERNLEGQMVVDFAKRMDMAVVNTYFQKREEHRVTYKSGGRRTQVDYILCRRGNLKEISDCKVVVGESVARQHRMVVCRMTLMVCKTKRSKIEKKTKWWKLKKKECCEEFRQKLRQALGGQVVLPDDWETTAEVIREKGAGCVIWKEERR